MASFGDLVQKAFYLGVGVASYAGEKAGGALGELRSQAQKIADEMVARGEMTTEEAKKLVDEMVNRAQQSQQDASVESDRPSQPRRIEILSDDDAASSKPDPADDLRQQVTKLQEELRRLKRD
jgi:polyhydroxyalkanoate synthesis regulator phasin